MSVSAGAFLSIPCSSVDRDPAGKGVRRRVQLHQQRVHGHPAEQMVQRPAVRGPRAGDVRPRAAHAAGRRRLPGRVPHAGLRHPGRRRHPVPGARVLPLRAAQAPADAARLGVAEPEHHVRQPGACHPARLFSRPRSCPDRPPREHHRERL